MFFFFISLFTVSVRFFIRFKKGISLQNNTVLAHKSPEVPKGTFRDCKQSPRSRASPDFGSSPIQKESTSL
ncbi:hypothetical protein DW887_04160 [Lachnospiraceae bacterium AM40-2BH]|nr:hypothetical protein DW887_04160 [Lachnospiraceae bacterium AM40-2BH]